MKKSILSLLLGISHHYLYAQEECFSQYGYGQQKEGLVECFDKKGNSNGYFVFTSSDHGTFQEYYTAGQLKQEGKYENRRPIGNWKEYFSDGAVNSESYFTDGFLDETYTAYFSDGTIKMTGKFEHGKMQGKWTENYSNGEPKSIAYYLDHKLHGKTELYKYGKLIEYAHYNKGALQGEGKSYYKDGTLKMEALYHEGKAVASKEYFQNGNISVDENLHKPPFYRKFYYENGQLQKEITFNENQESTGSTSYYENGTLKEKMPMKGGKSHGECVSYHKNGKVDTKGNYINGERNGIWVEYNEQGKLMSQETYRMGTVLFNNNYTQNYKDGSPKIVSTKDKYEEYYENKQLKTSKKLKDGVPHGLWQEFDRSGNPTSKSYYKDGVQHGMYKKYYYGTKQLEQEQNYENGETVGELRLYYPNGQLKYYGVQETPGGAFVKFIEYHENGEAKDCGVYENGVFIKCIEYLENGKVKIMEGYDKK